MTSVSIIIPIYNEAEILERSITQLIFKLKDFKISHYEILLIENGSQDQTLSIAKKLVRKYSRVKVFSLDYADFGDALRQGITQSKYSYLVLFNADWWDVSFLTSSLRLLEKYSLVVGSKNMSQSDDRRPLIRRMGSRLLTYMLRVLFGFPGSDSHGLKAFRRDDVLTLLSHTVTHEILESELLIRAFRQGFSINEIPVSIKEVRSSRVSFLRRSLRVGKELLILFTTNFSSHEITRR